MCVTNELLLNIADKSVMAVKYACVIVHRNKIIATGYNHYDLSRLGQNCPCLL